jgi:hypothetical protein
MLESAGISGAPAFLGLMFLSAFLCMFIASGSGAELRIFLIALQETEEQWQKRRHRRQRQHGGIGDAENWACPSVRAFIRICPDLAPWTAYRFL